MSLSNVSLRQKNPFLIPKTRPRKGLSRSPLKLFGEALAHELGPQCQIVDIHIGNQRMILDIVQGYWIPEETDETTIDSSNMTVLKKRKRALKKENDILHAKLDMLFEMLAEVTAEETLQKVSNK